MRLLISALIVGMSWVLAPWIQSGIAFWEASASRARIDGAAELSIIRARGLYSTADRLVLWAPYALDGRWQELGIVSLPGAYARQLYLSAAEGCAIISCHRGTTCVFAWTIPHSLFSRLEDDGSGQLRVGRRG